MKKFSVIMLILLVAGILSACAPQEHRSFSLFRNEVVIQTSIASIPSIDSVTFIFMKKGDYDITFANMEGRNYPLPKKFSVSFTRGIHAEVLIQTKIYPLIVSVKHDGVTESVIVY